MARRYRVFTGGQWVASSGNAVLCVTNPASSDKLIQIHQLEVHNNSRGSSGDSTNQSFTDMNVVRGTAEGGELVDLTPHDTDLTLPAGIRVVTDAAWLTTSTLRSLMFYKRMNPGSGALAQMWGPPGRIGRTNFNAIVDHPHNANVERMRARPGEAVGFAIGPAGISASMIWKCNITIKVVGLGNWSGYAFIRARCEAVAPLVLLNDSASDVVSIEQIDFQECGTVDSPFLRLVQFQPDPITLSDPNQIIPVAPFDSADDAFPGIVTCNVPGLPQQGVPQAYISDGSPATPKGVSYLHTKDFEGPQLRVMFPEANRWGRLANTAGGWSLAGHNQKTKMWAGEAPVSVRPGESVAIISSAETATASSAVPVSGWSVLSFGLTMSVSDLVVPSITLTGMATGTVVAVLEAGTETVIDVLSESGGSVSWEYASSPGDFVDLAILAAGKVYQKIEGLELTAMVRSIPVTQVDDPVYDGALTEAVTFSGSTKRIVCDAGNTELDVRALYTAWVDWALLGSNLRFLPAFTTQGFTEIDPSAGTKIPAYAYLQNAWRVRPQEANHTLVVSGGVLLVDGGGDPFVDTLGAYTVRINYQQPVQAIVVNTAGTVAPTQGEIQTAVRSELATEMARLDVAVSTRLAEADYTAPDNAAVADVATDVTAIRNLVEADEIHTSTTVEKRLRGTSTVLLTKEHTGAPLVDLEVTDPPPAPSGPVIDSATPNSATSVENPAVVLTGSGFVTYGVLSIVVYDSANPPSTVGVGGWTVDSDTQITITADAAGVVPSLMSLGAAPMAGVIMVTPSAGTPATIGFVVG